MSPFFGLGNYRDFAALARHEREGHAWRRMVAARGSAILIAAPHGGGIERGTTEIAQALAGPDLSFYSLLGTKLHGNERLHISSHRFDDPAFLDLAAGARVVVALHGCQDTHRMVYLGGRHDSLRLHMATALESAALPVSREDPRHPGEDPRNLCNRGRDGRGVQLELSHGLRRAMFVGLSTLERRHRTPLFEAFVGALRPVLLGAEREMGGGGSAPA
jgi:phage replication-related protein YjqB (UPF0714/DUF867 family)